MIRRSTLSLFAGLSLAVTGCLAVAEQAPVAGAAPAPASLRIGDQAQDLSPEILWLRNMLVPEFKDDTVYILYLWSPDSPGSMGSFPQLHGLDKTLRSRGVVTISIAIDIDEGGFEPIDVIKSRAEFFAHTVAEDRKTYIKDHWFTPSGYDSAPVVFVIDRKGTIAFMDDKLSQVEQVALAVLDETWDIGAGIDNFDRVREIETRMQPVIDEATNAAVQGDWARVVVLADKLLEADRDHYYKMAMTKFMLNLTKLGKPGDAYEWGYAIVGDHIKNDSAMLVTMADTILFAPGIPYRDYNLARKAAERADKLTDGKLGQVKNALAGAWHGLGENGRAVEFQMEAVRLAPTSDTKQTYQSTLDRYLGQLPSPQLR